MRRMATKLCAALLIESEVSPMANKNCVAYMRYSTDNQTENSIEYQRAEIEKYCAKNGFTTLKEYVDEAYSATNDRRPNFLRMVADAQSNPGWDSILVYDFSRIFRNVKDAALYKAILRDSGIRIISATEPFSDSDEGWLTETITDTLNEYYSRQTKRKTHAGMAVKANQACHCGGVPPLGYNVDSGGKLTVNDAEAEIVREIFRLYNLGYSYNKMAENLNAKGYRTKAGKPFTKNSFPNILTQEKYIGTYVWNKRKAKDSKGRHNNHAYKSLKEQTVVEDGCPVIVPLEQFQETQERLFERRQGRADTKSRHHYMLGGMKRLKCAQCGAYMVGKVTTSHGKKYTSYACPNHKGGRCPSKDIRADDLELYTSTVIVESLMVKSNLPQLNQCLKSGGGNDEARQLRNRLTSTNKKIGNIVKSLEYGYSDALSEKLRQLEREKTSLTSQLQEANKPASCVTAENLKEIREELVKYIRTSNAPEVRELLMKHVEEIRVSNENVTVSLQF